MLHMICHFYDEIHGISMIVDQEVVDQHIAYLIHWVQNLIFDTQKEKNWS